MNAQEQLALERARDDLIGDLARRDVDPELLRLLQRARPEPHVISMLQDMTTTSDAQLTAASDQLLAELRELATS